MASAADRQDCGLGAARRQARSMDRVGAVSQNVGGSLSSAEQVRPYGPAARGRHAAERLAEDQVELSATAQAHDPEAEAGAGQKLRIEDLRRQIEAGTYLTPDKIDAVVERLYELLRAGLQGKAE